MGLAVPHRTLHTSGLGHVTLWTDRLRRYKLYFSQIGLWTTIQNSGSVPSATVHVPSATVQAATTAADAATPRIHMSRIHRNIKYGLSTLFL